MAMERLDKILAGTGRWSRKEVRELAKLGRVEVNGQVVRRPDDKFDRTAMEVRVDGEPVSLVARSAVVTLIEAVNAIVLN